MLPPPDVGKISYSVAGKLRPPSSLIIRCVLALFKAAPEGALKRMQAIDKANVMNFFIKYRVIGCKYTHNKSNKGVNPHNYLNISIPNNITKNPSRKWSQRIKISIVFTFQVFFIHRTNSLQMAH